MKIFSYQQVTRDLLEEMGLPKNNNVIVKDERRRRDKLEVYKEKYRKGEQFLDERDKFLKTCSRPVCWIATLAFVIPSISLAMVVILLEIVMQNAREEMERAGMQAV